jgi:single-strand DNA-binding protein
MTLPTITATGRLGADPDLSFTPSGKAVAKFRMACDERRKEGDEWKTIGTTWLSVDQWGDDAEAAAHNLQKGDLVTVVGLLNVREYEKDGTKRLSVEIKYGRVSKALPKAKNGTGAPIQQSTSNPWDQQGGGSAWGTSEQAPF